VADFYNQRVQMLRPDGTFVRQWGKTGKSGIGAGQLSYPTDVVVTADGTVYVADGYNDRIQVFDAEGNFLRKWGGPFAMNIFGPFNGWFATVTSVALDAHGNVFVADFYNHRIQKFAADGAFLTSFGSEGSGPGQFNYPIAVAVAADGTVFVADFGNHRVQRWQPRVR
ncbi:MAG TPA: 6-bladed beta-propeller, partial [Gammaproteobacteria bacterium]